jgi:hypothetical protein
VRAGGFVTSPPFPGTAGPAPSGRCPTAVGVARTSPRPCAQPKRGSCSALNDEALPHLQRGLALEEPVARKPSASTVAERRGLPPRPSLSGPPRKGEQRVGETTPLPPLGKILMKPDSAQKSRPIDPVFRADSVVLAISAAKDGNLRVVYARIGRCPGRPAWRGAQAAVTRPYPAVTCHDG